MADLVFWAIALAELCVITAAGFWAGQIIHRLLVSVAQRIVAHTATTLDDLIVKAIEGPLEAAVILLLVFGISHYLDNLGSLRALIERYSLAIIVFLAFYVLSEVVGALLRWYYYEGREKSKVRFFDVSLLPFARKATRIMIVFVGITTSLAVAGVEVSGILAVTSVVALIIGLASQETLGNIFAGMALQVDRPFSYGDYLRFASGEVVRLQKIGLRSTKFSDLSGNIMVLSNSELAKQRMTNLSKPSDGFRFNLPAEVEHGTELSKLAEHLDAELNESRLAGTKPAELSIMLEKVTKDALFLSISFWVSEYSLMPKARDFVNRKLIQFPHKKAKNGAKEKAG